MKNLKSKYNPNNTPLPITVENPNGINLGLDNTYIPIIKKENQFTIDVRKMSFKQIKQAEQDNVENPFELLRQEAIEKRRK